MYRGIAGGTGTGVLGIGVTQGRSGLPVTGVPLAVLLLIALTMIVVGVVMTRVAFGPPPAAAGEGPTSGTERGTSRS